MDHRITVAIIAVFGGTLAFTFFTVAVTTSVQSRGPDAAVAATADVSEAPGEAGPPPRERLIQVLQTLDRQTHRWVRDHGGRQPDFEKYPAWQQFIQATGAAGEPVAGRASDPYLPRPPVNPMNQLSAVAVVHTPLRPAARLPEAVGRVGFVYSTADKCYWGTNASGRMILARAAEPATPRAPAPAPKVTPPATRPALPATAPLAPAR